MTIDEFFRGYPESKDIFAVLLPTINQVGAAEMRVTKSQIAFRRRKAFTWVWIPEKALRRKAAPLVLSLAYTYRDPSLRWKQVVEPVPGRFMHHLELHAADDIETEVSAWLHEAWDLAG